MNIPDEVLSDAARRMWDIEESAPEDTEWDDLATSFRASLMTQVEAACQPIAEWARKEALREAAAAVDGTLVAENRDEWSKGVEWAAAHGTSAIRALAEGDQL